MIRNGFPALLVALSPMLLPSTALGNEAGLKVDPVASLEVKLTKKQGEINTLDTGLSQKKAALESLKKQRAQHSKRSLELEKQRQKAQADLDKQYNRMLDNPDIDISAYHKQYQDSWNAVKSNQVEILTITQDIEEQQRQATNTTRLRKQLLNELENLAESKQEARVRRARAELEFSDNLEVIHTITCNTTMTLAECANQGKTLTMQKAVSTFQDQLLTNLTEADLAQENSGKVAFNIHVLNNQIIDSGFSGNNRYITRLQSELKARPSEIAACQLLGLANRYCVKSGDQQSSGDARDNEKRWLSMTIRSNRHEDKVTVNGVDYGNTPVDVMLPTGKHQVTIEKPGFEPYSRQVSLGKDLTIWAELKEQKNRPSPGKNFADTLKNNYQAPKMVVIGSGQYSIGPNAEQNISLNKAYSIGATPVTVKQFELFVNNTGYITEAEKGAGCSTITEGGEVTLKKEQNWRKPGFAQQDNAPAVCISRNDAETYNQWLSKQTGYSYHLPSETQWEVAARAGSKTAFWWGDDIGAGKANTGWSGSSWSNKSTSPVMSFAANPYGIYDTAGNVWEWTKTKSGVVRGGSWSYAPSKARVFERLEQRPSISANYIGFRVVRDL